MKKFDRTSVIGMLLMGLIIIYIMYTRPAPEEIQAREEAKQEQIDSEKPEEGMVDKGSLEAAIDFQKEALQQPDSLRSEFLNSKLGAFGYSGTLPSAKDGVTVVKNDVLELEVSNKGGHIVKATLLQHKTYDSIPVYLIKDGNSTFNISFNTTDNRNLNTKDLFFEPALTSKGENQILSMKLKVDANRYLEYYYEIKPDNYMIDFSIRSQGLNNVINSSQSLNLDWQLDAYRNEKSLYAENMYTWYYYKADGDVDYLNKDDAETENNVDWVTFKQHFFTSILKTDTPFTTATIESKNLSIDDEIDTVFTRKFILKAPLDMKGGELNYAMNMYYGPSDYKTLQQYENTDLDETVDLGWGIFGWINRIIFIPVFSFLSSFMSNYGLLIILMTIVVRIIMSPAVYKSYLSSARMKVLRPEMKAINERLPGKENAMKRQQETMALQRKAGVSPLSGCIPALIQMPIFFALFKFFPTNLALRQESFLWANDLSSYDVIAKLPDWLDIPFYGNHVSLFPILASVAIFFYMKMNQSQQMNMQAPTQEGMPDMGKMMKLMIYFSPIMMLFFFNNYASSLSLYYFISNLLTIAIMLVIKNYVIDEKKIIAQIEENKAKPEKKKSKFRQRLDDAMKQAQEQQAQQKKKK